MNKVKALVLFSGGLDSLLAIRILEKQGIEVAGICFHSVFFGCSKAEEIAKKNNIKFYKLNFNEEILGLVKNPPHGLGKNMNPCIDCHATMFKLANAFAQKNGYAFLASGEVLGQRPFSQNKKALEEVLKIARIEVLRPLSAKLLSETDIEKKGLVDRGKLLDFQGRQRNKQLTLAEKFKIKDFQSPSGGCLLTESEFSNRLKRGFENFSKITYLDVELFKRGRIYWLKNLKNQKILVAIGRNKEDNDFLEKLFTKNDLLIKPLNFKGPSTLVRIDDKKKLKITNEKIKLTIPNQKPLNLEEIVFKNNDEMMENIVKLTGWYITSARGKRVEFQIL